MALLVHGLLLTPVWFPLQTMMGLIWAGVVPGALAVHLLLSGDRASDMVERILLALGLGYVSLVLGTLILHYLPGPLTRVHLLIFYDALVLVLLALSMMPASARSGGNKACTVNVGRQGRWLSLLVLLLIAALFRLSNLNYSEFQGDEVAVLQKATSVLQGHDDILFLHKKGPAEILLAALTYGAGQRINEGTARLPFAIANMLGVMGVYALGRRAFSHQAGWWAALLLALNGFLIAFARIVQYQNLVFLFSILGLLSALRFMEDLDRRYLWLSALFLASGLLAHSDAIFATVAAAFVILKAFFTRRVAVITVARQLAGPIVVSSILLAVFYVPFVLHPHFQAAQGYFGRRAGQPPYNNLNDLLTMGTVYNSAHYLVLVGVGLVWIGMVRLRRISRPSWLLPVAFSALLTLSWRWPGVWRVHERDFIGSVFLVLLLVIFLFSKESPAWQSAFLWFGLSFLFYAFLFKDPRSHVHVLFVGASLMLGVEINRLAVYLKDRAWLLNGAVVVLLTIGAVYSYIMFVSHVPEYKRTYPEHRIHFFWVPYGDKFPKEGLFGFPYRAGWKVIGYLYATGVLEGDYGTNEETHITGWYTRNDLASCSHPQYYFIAKNVQDRRGVPTDEIETAYEEIGQIWLGDRLKMRMYERKPARVAFREYRLEEASTRVMVESVFDHHLSGLGGPSYPLGLSSHDILARIQYPAQLRLGSAIEFLGHDLDKTQASPGGLLSVTLYWQLLSPVTDSYTVFTHLEDPGVVWGQMDSIPHCGNYPTDRWEVDYVIADHYTFTLSPETPAGPHALVAGMYRGDTGERLAVTDATGVPLGPTLNLGTIDVVSPGEACNASD